MHLRPRNPRPLAAALVLAVALLASLAWAGPGGGGRPPHGPPPHGGGGLGGERLERLVDQLGLDPGTLAAVDAELDASRIRGRELRRELRAAHQSMRGLLEAPEPDETAIYDQVDRIAELEARAQKNRLGTLLRVRALIPPEARERLLGLMQRRGPGRDRSHRRGPPPSGSPR